MTILKLTGSTATAEDPGSGGGVRTAISAMIVGVLNLIHSFHVFTPEQMVLVLTIVTPALFVLAWVFDKYIAWRLLPPTPDVT